MASDTRRQQLSVLSAACDLSGVASPGYLQSRGRPTGLRQIRPSSLLDPVLFFPGDQIDPSNSITNVNCYFISISLC